MMESKKLCPFNRFRSCSDDCALKMNENCAIKAIAEETYWMVEDQRRMAGEDDVEITV